MRSRRFQKSRRIALNSSYSAYENLRYLVDKYAPWPTGVPRKHHVKLSGSISSPATNPARKAVRVLVDSSRLSWSISTY